MKHKHTHNKRVIVPIITITLMFIAIGIYLLHLAWAQTPLIMVEPEQGQITAPAQKDATDGNAAPNAITFKAPASPAVISTFTLATWNSWNDNSRNIGDQTKTLFGTAHIVGLQEVHDSDSRKEIRDKLTCSSCAYSSTITNYTLDEQSKDSNPIIWNKSRFTIVGVAGSLQATVRAEVDDSGSSSLSPRFVSWVKLKDIKTGKQLYVLNTHMLPTVESLGKPQSGNTTRLSFYRQHMDKIVAKVNEFKKENVPIFILGDFNVNYRYDKDVKDPMFPYSRFNAVGVKSGYELLKLAGISSDQSSYDTGTRLIDYVFMTVRPDLTAKSEKIHNSMLGSDHYPVFTTVDLKK